jgi:predicted DsbA family dithiol-disulfide isomerase
VRLHQIATEYTDRVAYRSKFFPLELLRGEGPPRDLLEHEWWLASIQEPRALFTPYTASSFPDTTLPAFDAVCAARQQGDAIAMDLDLRVRRAFFGESRNIGDAKVLRDIASEAGLDMTRYDRDVANPATRAAVLEESRIAREVYHVRGTPTFTLGDGTRLRMQIAYPSIKEGRIVGVARLTCVGEACDGTVRVLFDQVIAGGAAGAQMPAS